MNPSNTLRPHHCKVSENIVELECRGPWDAESLQQLIDIMAPLKAQVADSDWGMLLVLHDDAFLLSDTVKTFTETVKKDKLRGRKATAVVLEDNNSYEMSRSLFERVFRGPGSLMHFFTERGEGKRWLQLKLMPRL